MQNVSLTILLFTSFHVLLAVIMVWFGRGGGLGGGRRTAYLCLHYYISFSRLVGVGEASFVSLAAPFIDDNAPVAQVWFLMFIIL